MSNHSSIPSLDLNHFRLGTPKQKQQFIQDLGNAYEEIGFAAVKNHMLPNVLEQELYNQTKAFFKLPLDVKLKYSGDALAGQRGYTGMGKEHAKGKSVGDLKEFWHFGQYLQPEDVNRFDYPNNIDVLELPAFNAVGKEAYARLEETGKYLLQAMAIFLDLEENFFNEKVHNGNSILRPIHYAPILEEPPTGAVRAGEHEDINLITLLMGASADGLEILSKENEWVAVTAVENHLVVNVGDMLQRLTNNRFKSTTHRVVNPPRSQWSSPRYSIPFFLHPQGSTRLDCLDSCISDSNPKQYDDISAGEYLTERLIEIGLLSK